MRNSWVAWVCAVVLALLSGCEAPANSVAKDPAWSQLDGEEGRMLELINDYRQRNGLHALAISPRLTEAAEWLSRSMSTEGYFSHTDSLGRTAFVRIGAFGYESDGALGENIAYGNEGAEATFEQWRNSPAHDRNMRGEDYREIGIGRHETYWTTDFGG